ncbi:hypothetical protein FHG66_13815 [Rubellimicrobium rubrum]|uniref:Uncharacterized protein n=1 Tax=Rubellimicrobium rubrum TaxID=2585369 RepID=A0A5C4MWD1_9RHOB|nr:hypothetical protein [Rubellimicrobium rubrum]TNC48427.1 hypothetical protein FHG66_13815 [Rubellimicrobium rubrum]
MTPHDASKSSNSRDDILRASRPIGRAIWRHWSGTHRRCLIDATTKCMKLLGERLSARPFDRQTAEHQIQAGLLNRFTTLAMPEMACVA